MIFNFTYEYEEFFNKHVTEENRIVDIRCYGGSPVEINADCLDLSEEVMEWLEENTKNFFYNSEDGLLDIPDQNEAMMFKLTWL